MGWGQVNIKKLEINSSKREDNSQSALNAAIPKPSIKKIDVVQSGDTLSKIARDNNTTVEEILELNDNIDDPNMIEIGEKIILPNNRLNSSNIGNEKEDGSYIVQEGDTLSKIARENNTTVDELVKLNDIKDPDYIETGDKIDMPTNVSSVSNNSSTISSQSSNMSGSSSSTNLSGSNVSGSSFGQNVGENGSTNTSAINTDALGEIVSGVASGLSKLFSFTTSEVKNTVVMKNDGIEELTLLANDDNVEKFDLFDLSWVDPNDQILINLLANKSGKDPDYVKSIFQIALDNGYLLRYGPFEMEDGSSINCFQVTDPYVLNSKGKYQENVFLSIKQSDDGAYFFSNDFSVEDFKEKIESIASERDEVLNQYSSSGLPKWVQSLMVSNVKECADKIINGIDSFFSFSKDSLNHISLTMNAFLSDFYENKIKANVVNLVCGLKSLNFYEKKEININVDGVLKLFNEFEQYIVDEVVDVRDNQVSLIKDTLKQGFLDFQSAVNKIVGILDSNQVSVNNTVDVSNMSNKELYDYSVGIIRDCLSNLDPDTNYNDMTNYEIIVLFSSNLSEFSELFDGDVTEFLNGLLQQQTVLLSTDRDVFTDYLNYKQIDEEDREDLFADFDKGNGAAAMATVEMLSIDSQIEDLEKENDQLSKDVIPGHYYMGVRLEEPNPESQKKINENNRMISELNVQKYNLKQQYQKNSFNYLINLRDSEEYLSSMALPDSIKITMYDSTTFDFPIENIKEQILRDGCIHLENLENVNSYITDDEWIIILEKLYQDDEVIKAVLGDTPKTREEFVNQCFSMYLNSQSVVLKVYSQMSDDQVNDCLYLSKNESSDRAKDFIYSMEDDVNRYYGQKRAEEEIQQVLSGKETFVDGLKSLGVSTANGFEDGLEGWFDNVSRCFTGDTTVTSQQYASQYFLQIIGGASMFMELSDSDIEELLNDEENPIDQATADQLKKLDSPCLLDVYLETKRISQEDYDYYKNLKNEEPYASCIEKLQEKSVDDLDHIEYLYKMGLNFGNTFPSFATSAVFSFAGLPSLGQKLASTFLFASAYGNSYQEGIQKGKNTEQAIVYAGLSASSEFCTEVFLGHIPGISLTRKFLGKSRSKVGLTFKSFIFGALKKFGGEMTEEEFQNVLQIVFDGLTGNEFDFSNLKEESIDTAIISIGTLLFYDSLAGLLNLGNTGFNKIKNFQNEEFSIKFRDGTIVPMSKECLVDNNIINLQTNEFNLEAAHQYFDDYRSNNLDSNVNLITNEVVNEGIQNITDVQEQIQNVQNKADNLVSEDFQPIQNLQNEITQIQESTQQHQESSNAEQNTLNVQESTQSVVDAPVETVEQAYQTIQQVAEQNGLDDLVVSMPEPLGAKIDQQAAQAHQMMQDEIQSLKQKNSTEQKLNDAVNGMQEINEELSKNPSKNVDGNGYEIAHQKIQEQIQSMQNKTDSLVQEADQSLQNLQNEITQIQESTQQHQESRNVEQNTVNVQESTQSVMDAPVETVEQANQTIQQVAEQNGLDDLIASMPEPLGDEIDRQAAKIHQMMQDEIQSLKQKNSTEQKLNDAVNGMQEINDELSQNPSKNVDGNGYEIAHQKIQEQIQSMQNKTDSLVQEANQSLENLQNEITQIQESTQQHQESRNVEQNTVNVQESTQSVMDAPVETVEQARLQEVLSQLNNVPFLDFLLDDGSITKNQVAELMVKEDVSVDVALKMLTENVSKEVAEYMSKESVSKEAALLMMNTGVSKELATIMSDDNVSAEVAQLMLDTGISRDVAMTMKSYNVSKELAGIMSHDNVSAEVAQLMLDTGISRDVAMTMKSYNVSEEVARVMVSENVSSEIAQVMLKENIPKKVARVMFEENVSSDVARIMYDESVPKEVARLMLIKNITRKEAQIIFYNNVSEEIASVMALYDVTKEKAKSILHGLSNEQVQQIKKRLEVRYELSQEVVNLMSKENVSSEVAQVMLIDGVSSEVANIILKENVSKEVAEIMLNEMNNGNLITPEIAQVMYEKKLSFQEASMLPKEFRTYESFVDEYYDASNSVASTLSDAEKMLISDYTQDGEKSGYVTLNGMLRGTVIDNRSETVTFRHAFGNETVYTFEEFFKRVGETPSQFIFRTYDEVNMLNDIVSRNEFKEDTVVFRGVGIEALKDFGITSVSSESEIMESLGRVYTEKGFLSASPINDGRYMDKEVNFIINCKKGKKFADFSLFNSGEQEIVLGSDSRFKITDVKKENNKIKIYMTSLN